MEKVYIYCLAALYALTLGMATAQDKGHTTGAGTALVPHQGDVGALKAFYKALDGGNWIRKWDLEGDPFKWHGVAWGYDARAISLDLPNNNLKGEIPPEIGKLVKLTLLNLSMNEGLTGTIPAELGGLKNLHLLSLSGNGLNGTILSGLGNLPYLSFLDLSLNHLSGTIPPELGNLSNLKSLNLCYNKLDGQLPPELGNLNKLTMLSLNHNSLTGTIPKEYGKLANLRVLNLGGNKLHGVSCDFNSLDNLMVLRLYGNNFDMESLLPLAPIVQKLPKRSVSLSYQANLPVKDSVILARYKEKATLSTGYTCKGCNYQWKYKGKALGDSSGNPNYTFDHFAHNHKGYYQCIITHPALPGVEMRTNSVYLDNQIIFTHAFVTEANWSSIHINIGVDKPGKVYYMALPSGNDTPTAEHIIEKAEQKRDSNNWEFDYGCITVDDPYNIRCTISGLAPSTPYDIYFVGKDTVYNTMTRVIKLQTTTQKIVGDDSTKSKVRISPRIVTDKVSLEVPYCCGYYLAISDMKGKMQAIYFPSGQKNELDMSELPAGEYVFEVKTEWCKPSLHRITKVDVF